MSRIRSQLELVLQDTARRAEHVNDFQRMVWDSQDLGLGADLEEVVRDLAYDLDFYRPDTEPRSDDPSLYGDSRLAREVRGALVRLSGS